EFRAPDVARHVEALARILVLAARPPVGAPPAVGLRLTVPGFRLPAPSFGLAAFGCRLPAAGSPLPASSARAPAAGRTRSLALLEAVSNERRLRLLFRVPQLAAREVAELRVGMPRLNLLERRHQLVARGRAEGRWLAAEDDRPVGKARRHYRSSRFSFSMSVVRFRFSRRAACTLLPCVRSSDRLMSVSSTPSM